MTSMIQVCSNHRTLERDGQPFFWLADTCWSAFTNITEEAWIQYLDLRRDQGVNVLQINTLPQWDRGGSTLCFHPFPTQDGARYRFDEILPDYFTRAARMCQEAVDRGFVLALVVMWCNYVPDTWAAKIFPDNVIPEEHLEPIVKTICETFNRFRPVYIVSGDTGFESELTQARYRQVTDLVDKYAPGLLKAYHIKGRYDGLPEDLAQRADLYFYQSGHNAAGQHMTHTLAESFRAHTPVRPVINSEPCYEQMGYSHKAYGRFGRREVRWALWQSLLAGASAGITYGAHGVWNWFINDMPKNPIAGEGFLQALEYTRALHFPGIADFAFAKDFCEGLGDLTPCQEVLAKFQEHIRAAKTSGGTVLLYVSVNAPIPLNGTFEPAVRVIDLETGGEETVLIRDNQIEMHSGLADALYILQTK
ncbi:MAG: DUF4038 domain-containing protein [Faecousia sp.]